MSNIVISTAIWLLFSAVCLAQGQYVPPSSCFLDTSYKLASSKTDYSFVANKTNMNSYSMQGCVQVGMWHLSRHGGRFPDSDDIQAINNLSLVLQKIIVEKNASWLCEADRVRMRNWKTKMTNPEQGNYLTDYGRRQMRELGNRMYLRLFNNIISTGFDISRQLKVSVTELIRTQQSADEYLNGLLNYASTRPTYDVNEINGYLLKYPDYCQKYIRDVKKSPNYCPELNTLAQNWISMKIDKQMFVYRLGVDIFELGLDLEETFDLVLKICQYEYLIDGTDSVWCKFFDQDTLKRLEYQEDIDYNCAYGYRYNISQYMTCDLVKNMLSNLNQMKQGKKIQLLFSHTSTLLSFYSTLGIARDPSNFDTSNILNENKSRKYRTSLIDPMNTNIAFVVYKCSSTNATNQVVDKYKVRAFMSESLLTLEACQSTECDLDQFVNYYQSFVNQCQSTEASCAI